MLRGLLIQLRRPTVLLLLAAAIVVLVAIAVGTSTRQSRTQFGFVGTLSGDGSAVGSACRDGVMLAVEECNAGGGIDGRDIELILRDDRSLPQLAEEAIGSLAREGCRAIIGPTSTRTAPPVITASAANKIVVISPTVGGVDQVNREYFFSVFPHVSTTMEFAARRISMGFRGARILMVVDGSGGSAEASARALEHASKLAGMTINSVLRFPLFVAQADQIARQVIDQLATQPADCIVVMSNAAETAILIQRLRIGGCQLPVFATESSDTEDLLSYGGRALEGLTLFGTVNHMSAASRYHSFTERFRKRFGYEAPFGAVHGYEATRIALEAIAQTSDSSSLRRALLTQRSYDGLQGRIVLSESGGTKRELSVAQVHNGILQTIE